MRIKPKVRGIRITLINPTLPESNTPYLLKEFEKIRSMARKEKFIQIIEKFGIECLPPIPTHPITQKFRIHDGLLSVASFLEKNGYKVKYLQQDFLEEDRKWNSSLKIASRKSDIIGITSYTPSYHMALKITSEAKKINSQCKIVFGGPHVTFLDKEAIVNGADIVIKGEGENTMLKIVQHLEKNLPLRDVCGITYKSGKKIVRNPDSVPLDLNSLPPPAYHLIPRKLRKYSEIVLWTSRGCYFNCQFCTEKHFFGKVRFKKPENFLRDVEEFKKYFDSKYIFITDSTFPLDRKWFEYFYKTLKKENPDVYFGCQTRADILNKDILKKLTKLNFIEIFLGIESGSDEILKEMNKGETFNDYKNILRITKNLIPFIMTSWIVGFPGETFSTVSESIEKLDWLHKNNYITDSGPRVFIPYPGTSQFSYPERYKMKILTYDFEKYIRNNFPPVYRLENLNEYELWVAFFYMFLTGTKHIVKNVGMEKEFENLNICQK